MTSDDEGGAVTLAPRAVVNLYKNDPALADPGRLDFRGKLKNSGPGKVTTGKLLVRTVLTQGAFSNFQAVRSPVPDEPVDGTWRTDRIFLDMDSYQLIEVEYTLLSSVAPRTEIDLAPTQYFLDGRAFEGFFEAIFTPVSPTSAMVPPRAAFAGPNP